jgi:hypothetical protein
MTHVTSLDGFGSATKNRPPKWTVDCERRGAGARYEMMMTEQEVVRRMNQAAYQFEGARSIGLREPA